MQKSPAILETLQVLKSQSSLQVTDLFRLKQWLVCGQELTELWKTCLESGPDLKADPDDFIVLQQASWEAWLRILQPFGTITPTFAWSDLQDPILEELDRNRMVAEQRLTQIKIQQAKLVSEITGIRPDRNRQVLLQKPIFDPVQEETYKKQKKACFHCEFLSFQWETNSEICFSVIDTLEFQQLQTTVNQLQSERLLRQQILLQQISHAFSKDIPTLQVAANEIGKLDYFLAVIQCVLPWQEVCWGRVLPDAGDSCFQLTLHKASHPVYRLQHESIDPTYRWTAVDLELSKVNVITGPNMGGKSVALHTIALLQTLFQYGLLLPARSYTAPFCSWLRYHGGDDSNAGKGISSFAGEMIRLSEILKLPGKGLALFDELARSTNPDEGEALAIAIIETAFEQNSITVCATHFPQVRTVPHVSLFQVRGLQLHEPVSYVEHSEQLSTKAAEEIAGNPPDPMDALLQSLHQHMSYKLIPVTSGEIPQYAFEIAARLGLPAHILEQGQKHLHAGRKHVHAGLEDLNIGSAVKWEGKEGCYE